MTVDEIVDFIHTELTVGCRLPVLLKRSQYEFLLQKAMNWFYINYLEATEDRYIVTTDNTFVTDIFKTRRAIKMPDDCMAVLGCYKLSSDYPLQIGIYVPSLAVLSTLNNQTVVGNLMTDLSQQTVYKVALDSLGDMINKLQHNYVAYSPNMNTKEVIVTGGVQDASKLIFKIRARIAPEYLFEDDYFQRYVIGLAKVQIGEMLTLYNYNLPGQVTINGATFLENGKAERDGVRDEIKGMNSPDYFQLRS